MSDYWIHHFEMKCQELDLDGSELYEIMQSVQNEPWIFHIRRKNRHRRKQAIQNGKHFPKNNSTFFSLPSLS